MYLRPLDPSSVPSSSSVKPKARMMQQRCESGFKLRKLNDIVEEDIDMQSNSNIALDYIPLSKPEGVLVPHTTTHPTIQEDTQRISAKSKLYNLCVLRHWKAPVYECCDDEGPCHMKLFIVKATIEIKEDSGVTVLECFGDRQQKKKISAEEAAEAALWYLKNVGHTLPTEKAHGETKPLQKMMVSGEPV